MGGCGSGREGPLGWPAARDRAHRAGERLPVAVREVPLARALGAVLGADVRALTGVPAFDASAMDGFAVAGPGPWELVGAGLAGAPVAVEGLAPGEAVEIATGARVPKGTEAVLPYELAERSGDRVAGPARAGRHVRWEGEETAPGETVLTRGRAVGPAVLGLASSVGHETLPVLAPRVEALVTGAEVTTSGLSGEGFVRDAIGPMLPGLVTWAGGRVERVRHLGDERDVLAAAIAGSGADVLVVCGSSSKGPADHLRSVLADLDAEVLVDGVSCRPGHPQLLARRGRTAVVGLPGNPGAALVGALTLVVPLLCAMAGRSDPTVAPDPVPVAGEVSAHPRDTRLVAVRLEDGRAVPVGHDGPASLRGAALADAYAVIPPDWRGGEADLLRLP
ncbi:molybdopterin molybdotransferase MoeA [Nocardiopsis sp. CC223A]|uniref:molybdopterin molybdotransferase MoeA n=1 Tax=Nocardiopsis sp. CC223A TaxID=3044051 RepID=UPI00278C32DB|nr:molybdopterin molybdotransferase MoeA [Nocardiopsis sp. CC223A]